MPDISIEVLSERVDQLLRGQEKSEDQAEKVAATLDALNTTVNNMVLNHAIEVQKTRNYLLEFSMDLKDTLREELQESVAELRHEVETGYVSKEEYRPVGRARDLIGRAVISIVVLAVALAIGVNIR